MQRPRRGAVYWLAPRSFLSLPSNRTQDRYPRDGSTPGEAGPPPSITKTTPYSQTLWRHFLSRGSFLLDNSQLEGSWHKTSQPRLIEEDTRHQPTASTCTHVHLDLNTYKLIHMCTPHTFNKKKGGEKEEFQRYNKCRILILHSQESCCVAQADLKISIILRKLM